jgi:hypothetical protein
VLFLLGLLLDALTVTADAVDRIGEPDRAVGGDGDVIGRVQLLAVVLVGDDSYRAVALGPCDASATMLTGDEASLTIDRVAVRIHRRLAEDAQVTVVFTVPNDAVVGEVAEQHIPAGREIHWAFGPAHAGGDALDRHGTRKAREPVCPKAPLAFLSDSTCGSG